MVCLYKSAIFFVATYACFLCFRISPNHICTRAPAYFILRALPVVGGVPWRYQAMDLAAISRLVVPLVATNSTAVIFVH